MRITTIRSRNWLAFFAAATLLSNAALAEEATTDISVYAGLEPVMQLNCSSLNFGVYQIARGDRGIGSNKTTIQMATGSNRDTGELEARISFINQGQDQIALSDKPEYDPPQFAVCLVTGSRVKSGSLTIARESGFGSVSFAGVASNQFALSLGNPKTAATGILGYFTVPTSVQTDANGEAEFQVVGELDIPNNLVADNYGSYKAEPLTITVSDGL
ncbi:hypothetical protein LG288_11110 [Idiomarina seosinensis]|uniref:hypothetical protein n=1 Tax=Idiomarina seosinensis TaxID=281739 RepID=UPI00384AC95A